MIIISNRLLTDFFSYKFFDFNFEFQPLGKGLKGAFETQGWFLFTFSLVHSIVCSFSHAQIHAHFFHLNIGLSVLCFLSVPFFFFFWEKE